jgi:hypothetical protein
MIMQTPREQKITRRILQIAIELFTGDRGQINRMSLLAIVDHDINLAGSRNGRIKSFVQRRLVHLIQNHRMMNGRADHGQSVNDSLSTDQFATGNNNARPCFRERS